MAGRNDALEELKVKLDILIKNYNNLQKYKEAAEILKKENEQLNEKINNLNN